ncbi:MAG: haloacid dehalogenase-like hydrolase, partial [Alistipes sp.]|nr:haloacid dehalogenase-like hydrolase [Alistipes sp.]
GGHSVAVYNPKDKSKRAEMNTLIRDNRVNSVCPADYREGSEIDTVVKAVINKCLADYNVELLEVVK